jgi:hypothetical protein
MNHLKYYKLFESTSQIDKICKMYGIKNYTINLDGTIDVDGNVNLSNMELEKLPVKFGRVTGDFWCDNNQLTSLEGCPQTVGGHFLCNDNQLTTLVGCPTEVGGRFYCYNNQLTTLEGCPHKVVGNFRCGNNQLTSLEGCPSKVGGNFWCNNNKLTTLEGCPQKVVHDFFCDNNKLTTLEGLTDVLIGGNLIYSNNPIYHVTCDWLISNGFPDMERIELFNDIQIIIGNKLYLSKLEYFHDEIGKPLPDLEEVKKYYEIIE